MFFKKKKKNKNKKQKTKNKQTCPSERPPRFPRRPLRARLPFFDVVSSFVLFEAVALANCFFCSYFFFKKI